jgi:hypothetical protein
MPTIKRFSSSSINMYADDHNPPHFHIVGNEFKVSVAISTMEIITGDAQPRMIAEAMYWALNNREQLTSKWLELNERN